MRLCFGWNSQMDVVGLQEYVEVVAQARLDLRDELLHVGGRHVARPEVDGRARIVERASHVFAVHAGRNQKIVARRLVHPHSYNRREEDLRTHPGDSHASLEREHYRSSTLTEMVRSSVLPPTVTIRLVTR